MSGAVNKPQQGSPGFTSLTARVDGAGDGLPGRQEMHASCGLKPGLCTARAVDGARSFVLKQDKPLPLLISTQTEGEDNGREKPSASNLKSSARDSSTLISSHIPYFVNGWNNLFFPPSSDGSLVFGAIYPI